MPVSRRDNKEEKEEWAHQERNGLCILMCTCPLSLKRWQKEWQKEVKSSLCHGRTAQAGRALPCADQSQVALVAGLRPHLMPFAPKQRWLAQRPGTSWLRSTRPSPCLQGEGRAPSWSYPFYTSCKKLFNDYDLYTHSF